MVLSVAYRMSSCIFEKYRPVSSGQSFTVSSSSIWPSAFKMEISPFLEHSVKSNLATYSLPSGLMAKAVGPKRPEN